MMKNYISDSINRMSESNKKIILSGSATNPAIAKGISGAPKIEAYPDIIKKESDVAVEGNNGQYILFQKDPIRGDKGYANASAVRIVAGHFGASLDFFKDSDTKAVAAAPNFDIDSAYIYVSATSDPDENLRLKNGSIGSAKNKSTVILKGDAVRILGDGGIKLVTQRLSVDSKREGTAKLKGVDIIAGNDDTGLQPITKAENMSKAMQELYDLLARFIDTVSEALHWQHRANMEIASHQHITTAPDAPTLPVNSSLKLTVKSAALQFEEINTTKLALLRDELFELENRFTNRLGDDYIGSLYNNTN